MGNINNSLKKKKPNVIFDAQVTTEEEYNCILIYNDETKVTKAKLRYEFCN